MKCSTSQIK